uniref:Uncharacterized protein n=1 Tax=Avena sativa TaxID=4498 RepID=A0ACD5XLY6_AVESA
MTQHGVVVVPEDTVVGVAVGRHFSFPPPRTGDSCKMLAGHIDLSATMIGSWLDSMKASSPRHKLVAPRVAAAGDDMEHDDDWMEKHPSALGEFETLAAAASGKQIVMFLDYDGTLSPIVEDPDSAIMTDEMRDAVRAVAEQFPTAIVSGRGRDKVFNFVRLAELYYAGSHGMDIQGPTAYSNHLHTPNKEEEDQTRSVLCQPASEFLPMIGELHDLLVPKMASIPGAKVENNKFCLSVHFRCVDEKKWGALADQVRSVLRDYPRLRLTQGRKVLEIRPAIKWDKGRALEFLLGALGFADRADVFPIYIGDDRTDEDAFKVLRNRGQGAGILVTRFPKETLASFSLREPAEVKDFLRKLVMYKS